MLVIRRAVPEDGPAMSVVLLRSIGELCAADHGNDPEALAAWTRNKTEAGVRAMLAAPDARLFVAERDGDIVAVGGVSDAGLVTLNYVLPEARFSGVSKALRRCLEAELSAMGFAEGRLDATKTAMPFYLATGWLADGPQASGRKVNGFPMRKVL